MVRQDLQVLGRKITRGKVPVPHQGYTRLPLLTLMVRTLVAWPRGCLPSLYAVRSFLPLFPCHSLLIQATRAAHAWGMGRQALPLWGQSSYINYLEFFCIGDLSLFPHSCNHMLISVWTPIYSLGYHSILCYFLAQTVPFLAIGRSFRWLLSSDISPLLCFLEH